MAGPMVGESDTIWIGNGDGYVAQVTRIDGLEPIDWADAHLIAAAPDLARALADLLADAVEMGLDESPVSGSLIAAREALRKAGVL
jgi:hypothetical protein